MYPAGTKNKLAYYLLSGASVLLGCSADLLCAASIQTHITFPYTPRGLGPRRSAL